MFQRSLVPRNVVAVDVQMVTVHQNLVALEVQVVEVDHKLVAVEVQASNSTTKCSGIVAMDA